MTAVRVIPKRMGKVASASGQGNILKLHGIPGAQNVQERLCKRFEVLETVAMKITVFLYSCSPVDIYRSFGETYCLLLPTILEMEVAHSSVTSINLYQTVQCHIPEEINFQNHCRYGIRRFTTFTTPLNHI